MTNKIPPGEYSVENGKLRKYEGNLAGYADSSYGIKYIDPLFTIGFHLEGIPQLEIRERSAEEVLSKKNIVFYEEYPDSTGTAYDIDDVLEAMKEYRFQPIAPVSEEEIERKIIKWQNEYEHNSYKKDFPNEHLSEHGKLIVLGNIASMLRDLKEIKAALSRTQSGYTREQVGNAYEEGYHLCAYNHRDRLAGTDLEMSNMLEVEPMSKNDYLASLTPSLTSVTIGDNNNIIDFKYKL